MATKKKATKKSAPKKAHSAKKPAPKKAAPKKPAKAVKRAPAPAKKKAAAKKASPPAKKAAVAKKSAPKSKLAAAAPKAPAKKPVKRRDATGHLSPRMAADFRRQSRASREDIGNEAFVKGTHSDDDLAETLGEEAVSGMTGADDAAGDVNEQVVAEEFGGPFVETTGGQEFARGVDESNPRGSKREPFPKA